MQTIPCPLGRPGPLTGGRSLLLFLDDNFLPPHIQKILSHSVISVQSNTAIPESIPLRRDPATVSDIGSKSGLQSMLLLLLFMAGLIWLLRKFLKAQKRNPSLKFLKWRNWIGTTSVRSDLAIVRSDRLTTKASLHVIHWNKKEWLLGCTETSLFVIDHKDMDSEAVRSGDSGESPCA